MNTERLVTIASAIVTDFEEAGIIQALDQLIGALEQVISSSNEQTQTNLQQAVQTFYDSTTKSKYSSFPRTWRANVEELDIENYMGPTLRVNVETILGRHQITLTMARDEIGEIRSHINNKLSAMKNAITGLSGLGMEPKALSEYEAELSALMPRKFYRNELGQFSKELKIIDDAISFFSEIATGRRETPEIKTISSTEPFITIAASLGSVLLVLKIVNEIQKIRINTDRLRKIRSDLAKEDPPKETIDAVDKAIKDKVQEGLEQIIENLDHEFHRDVPEDRRAGLKHGAREQLQNLSDRMDVGYELDGDVGLIELETPSAEEGIQPESEEARLAKEIKLVSTEIRYGEIPSTPVLKLSSETDKEDDSIDQEDGENE